MSRVPLLDQLVYELRTNPPADWDYSGCLYCALPIADRIVCADMDHQRPIGEMVLRDQMMVAYDKQAGDEVYGSFFLLASILCCDYSEVTPERMASYLEGVVEAAERRCPQEELANA